MSAKTIKTRVQNKHDLEVNWLKAGNNEEKPFIPLAGEIIIYDKELDENGNILAFPTSGDSARDFAYDYARYKIGDGFTNINDLPFSIIQADWKQDDETAPDYIKNKLGLELGEAAKTTQQPGSLAISEGATAFGVENFAGLRSFEIIGWDINNSTYTISSPLSEEVPVGAEFGIQVRLIYYRHGTIINISEDRLTLTVDNYVDIDAEIANKGPDIAKYIWFTDYPTVGDTDEGLYAFTSGAVNQATHFAATALGYGNKAVGKYAVALGRQTEAHYAAFAAGYDTHAINEEAIAIGYSSTASARVSTAIGQGLKATEKNQIVLGRFNEEDPNALLIVGNGTKDSNRSNAFTVGFDGQLKTPFEPTSDENLVNKKYVDNVESSIDDKLIEFESSVNTTLNEVEDHLDTFQNRLANIEAGYITLSTETSEIQLPKMPANDIIISKIGGKSIEGINKLNPKYVIKGGSAKGQGASFELNNNDIIVTYDTTGGGIFAFGVELDVIPDTIYRIAFARTGTGNSVGTIYFYSDKLWGTSVNVYSPSANTTKNTVSFKGDYLTFNSGNNTHLVIGFYSTKNRTVLTETFSNVMITEGEDEVSYVPYYIAPSKTTIIKSYTKNGVQIGSYDIPTTIQNLPGYGHTDSSVDFMALTYSYKTTDGENFTTLPTVISIADLISEAPRLQAESEGNVQFVNNQASEVYGAILYQKDSDNAQIVGYSNTYEVWDEYSNAYNTKLNISMVDPNESRSVLTSRYTDSLNLYETILSSGCKQDSSVSSEIYLAGGYGNIDGQIDLQAAIITANGKEIATQEYVDNKTNTKQDTLVSGTNIKTVNGQSILGQGDIAISGSGESVIEAISLDELDNICTNGGLYRNGVMEMSWYQLINDGYITATNGELKATDSLKELNAFELVVDNSVTSIGPRAFHGCSSLVSIVIPDSVTSIGNSAFSECSSLTSVVIGDSVTSIDWYAFSSCNNLTSIVIPDSVTSIGRGAFQYCYNLSSVVIGDSVTSIDILTFYNCDSLTSIVIPDSVTSIGDHAFAYCNNLTSVVIGDGVTSMSSVAFDYCNNLIEIFVPWSEHQVINSPWGASNATIHYNSEV